MSGRFSKQLAMKDTSPALVAFAKDPERTAVKTRLSDSFDKKQRDSIYTALLRDTLGTLTELEDSARIYLACFPDSNSPFFKKLAVEFGVELTDQSGRDLGERLAFCLEQLLLKHRPVLIFGTDTPLLPLTEIAAAIDSCQYDLVLGSAMDGGYYAVGLSGRKPICCHELFSGVKWSTASVMDDTLKNAGSLSLETHTLPPARDIDTGSDIDSILASLDNLDEEKKSRMKSFLQTPGILQRG
ncbi:MAG: TIGR04282 family arsenosugar biosynthesis glycosyltransferase [Cyanobacteriota/Melainabacteria group bacterium]